MEENRNRIDEEKELIEKIEEKNKQLLKEININEKAMGYKESRERVYQEEHDRQEVQINNLEGD